MLFQTVEVKRCDLSFKRTDLDGRDKKIEYTPST